MIQNGMTLILFLGLFVSCSQNDSSSHKTKPRFGYNLEQPARVYKLPGELKEISGLQAINDHQIACIQDEDGYLYIYDLEEGTISQKIKFDKGRDYEGLALAGNDMYILESDGDLYHIPDFNTNEKELKARKIETGLKRDNNTEGACYDNDHSRLLIACKDDPGKGLKGKKAIYAFDLGREAIGKRPAYIIDAKEVETTLLKDGFSSFSYKIKKALSAGNISGLFKPSGIAIHPIQKNIYVISAANKLLAVLDQKGKLKHVYDFGSSFFMQPEGITFTSNGDLYISNEGNGRKANILKYSYDPKN